MSLRKRYLIGGAAREKLLAGAKIVYDLVSPTSGPKGRNIAYARPWGLPRIINDGIEIAKEVGSEDDFCNVGIDLIREAAANTVTGAGDGTTTAIILTYHILKQGIELIDAGENPMVIRSQMNDALALLLQDIHKLSTKIQTQEELKKVALISSSGDEEIAEVVAKTVFEMGVDGLVTTEEGNGTALSSEITRGLQLQKGYLDGGFITDGMRNEAVVVNPSIIVFEKVVTMNGEILPILEEMIKVSKNIVIFGDIRGEALLTLVINKARGAFQCLAVNPPEYSEQRSAVLTDIATLTGAKVITSATQSFHVADAGTASHVTANKTTTTIVNGGGRKDIIDTRIAEIKKKLDSDATLYEKEKFEERLSKLTAGVALIKVGAKSETLKREKFEKTKDAIGACKAALAEGIITGGGMGFITLMNEILKAKEYNVGERILCGALMEPTLKLLENAGKTDNQITTIMAQLKMAKLNYGFNVNTDKIENLMDAGVVDPLRVIRLSLENAVVVATSILTADGIIVDVPQKQQTT